VGDYVVLGPWRGRIDDVLDNLTVMFDDGSVCKVPKAEPLRLKQISKNILEDVHFPYYPGQRVRASSSSVFKKSYHLWYSQIFDTEKLSPLVQPLIFFLSTIQGNLRITKTKNTHRDRTHGKPVNEEDE
jgi:ubiquitin-conjugating enzyme E2 O